MAIASIGVGKCDSVVIKGISNPCMPVVIGDPMKIDALSALISVTGGDVKDMSLRRAGLFRFAKSLGPFEFMEVETCVRAKQPVLSMQHFTYGGEACHVSSTAIVSLVSFDLGVAKLRHARDALFKEAAIEDFNEKISPTEFISGSVRPGHFGWNIVMSMQDKGNNMFFFRLDLTRNLSVMKTKEEKDIVDVDI